MNNKEIASIHLAAQYLAAAGISFVKKREDDSHTNLGYSIEKGQIFTWPLTNADDLLVLDLNDFSLNWVSDHSSDKLSLEHRTHEDVLKWLTEKAVQTGLPMDYKYGFHYDLPYKISNSYTFQIATETLDRERQLRSLAQEVIHTILDEYGMRSDVRIWPHHFDTGALGPLPSRPEMTLGMGLAIPDSMENSHYFYLSGYLGHQSIETNTFQPLTFGKWYHQGFQGAVLPAKNVGKNDVYQFFKEAIEAYRNWQRSEITS